MTPWAPSASEIWYIEADKVRVLPDLLGLSTEMVWSAILVLFIIGEEFHLLRLWFELNESQVSSSVSILLLLWPSSNAIFSSVVRPATCLARLLRLRPRKEENFGVTSCKFLIKPPALNEPPIVKHLYRMSPHPRIRLHMGWVDRETTQFHQNYQSWQVDSFETHLLGRCFLKEGQPCRSWRETLSEQMKFMHKTWEDPNKSEIWKAASDDLLMKMVKPACHFTSKILPQPPFPCICTFICFLVVFLYWLSCLLPLSIGRITFGVRCLDLWQVYQLWWENKAFISHSPTRFAILLGFQGWCTDKPTCPLWWENIASRFALENINEVINLGGGGIIQIDIKQSSSCSSWD